MSPAQLARPLRVVQPDNADTDDLRARFAFNGLSILVR
jgi:hypothetical protein